jgi:hypothetical protein
LAEDPRDGDFISPAIQAALVRTSYPLLLKEGVRGRLMTGLYFHHRIG